MRVSLRLSRLNLPLRVGLIFAALGLILAIVGIIRGNVPLNPLSVFLALLISGGSWGLVSWAVATAVVDVESGTADDPVVAAADAEVGPQGQERGAGDE